jgi:hypothetical protein
MPLPVPAQECMTVWEATYIEYRMFWEKSLSSLKAFVEEGQTKERSRLRSKKKR